MEDVENLVLMHLDAGDIGDVRVGDVATVALTDNAGESYARVNGNDAVVLMFQKQSTASTSTVSEALNDEIAALQAEYEGSAHHPVDGPGRLYRPGGGQRDVEPSVGRRAGHSGAHPLF